MQLRPYQREALDKLREWLFEPTNNGKHPIVEASVGAGKSVMIAALIQELIEHIPQLKVLMLVHVKELLEQNYLNLMAVWQNAPAGLFCGGMGKYHTDQITYATIQSIQSQVLKLGLINIIIVDECHLINPENTGAYRKLINTLKQFNPSLRVIGFTGTPFRGNGVWLWEGKDALFDGGVCAKVGMKSLLEQGYLSPLVPEALTQTIKADGLAIDSKTGDYKTSALEKLMDDQDYTMMAVMELVQKARYHSRKSWLIFAVSIKHAEHILEQLLDQDVEAAMITGKTPKTERAKTIAAFKAGKITALVNVAVLTTGFDAPNCDLIALLRPTVSPVLYVQIAGRGMRTNEGKENCLWLDFTDTTERLGAVDTIKGRNKPKPKNSESDGQGVKICPSCEAENAPASKFCIECGEQLRDDVVFKVKAASSDSAVLSTQEKPREFVIDQWFLNHYTSKKGNEMLELCYYLHSLRPNMIKRWISFEGVDFMVSIANKWWLNHGGQLPLPTTNDEAVARFSELPQPETVWAKKNDQGYFNPV